MSRLRVETFTIAGERLFDGVNLPALGYACTQHVASPLATRIVLSLQ